MKKIFYVLLILLIFNACEIVTLDEYSLPEYDGELAWTEVVKKADWSNRLDHSSVVFDNKLWVLGGYNPGQVKGDPYYEDVWSSIDGENWEQVIDDAPWKGRRGHTVTTFNNGSEEAMYLTGGFSVDNESGYRQYENDIWKSTDGINWTLVKERTYPDRNSTTDWFPRMNHSCVVANHGGTDYLYIIGGSSMLENHGGRYSMVYFNDVWRSVDGINWERLDNNDYGIRSGHACTVDQSNGKIYIQGGMHGVIFEGENNQDHPIPNWQWLWSSEDGINWIPENDITNFNQSLLYRAEHHIHFYKNKLWGLSGKTISNTHFHFARSDYYTTWYREEGNIWTVDSHGSDIDARYSYSSVIFNDKIWVLGGDTNSHGPSNDVWYATLKQ